jgi:membrane protease subunit HflK
MRYVLALGLVLVLAYLLTGVTQVRPGERAVVRRFGRVLPDKPGPGLHLGLPWGMDRVDRVPVDLVRRVAVGYERNSEEDGQTPPAGQLMTGDRNLVNVQVIVNYALEPDDEAIVDYLLQADRADALVARAAESVLTEWVAGSRVDAVLLGDKAELRRRLVEETQARLEPYRLGVRVQEASVAFLAPPDQVKEAFDDVTRAQAEIDQKINDARAAADQAVQNAQAEKVRVGQSTQAYVADLERQRDVELRSFADRLKLYQQSGPKKTEFLQLIWHEEMAKLAAQMAGRIELLDDRLSGGGLDITTLSPRPPNK